MVLDQEINQEVENDEKNLDNYIEDQLQHVQFKSTSYKTDNPNVLKEKIEYVHLMKRILKLCRAEIPLLIVGSLGALLAGASYPAFAILFGDIYGVSIIYFDQCDTLYNFCMMFSPDSIR